MCSNTATNARFFEGKDLDDNILPSDIENFVIPSDRTFVEATRLEVPGADHDHYIIVLQEDPASFMTKKIGLWAQRKTVRYLNARFGPAPSTFTEAVEQETTDLLNRFDQPLYSALVFCPRAGGMPLAQDATEKEMRQAVQEALERHEQAVRQIVGQGVERAIRGPTQSGPVFN